MGREIGVFMLIMVIGLTFVCIAPLIPLAAALFYITNFVIWRYHVLYVYERGYESNGSVWFTFTQLVILSLVVAQTFLSCVLFSKQAYIQGAVLYATVPYYLFKVYRKFRAEFGSASSWAVPLSEATAAPPTEDYVYKMWGGILAVSTVAALATGANSAKVVTMLAATVCSFLVGNSPDVKAKMNPIVTTSVLANVYAAALGLVTGDGWMGMLGLYRTGVPFGLNNIAGLGAGDILMTFLGSVILSFAFKVFEARKIIARHAVEIFGCLVSTSMFAMFTTAVAGKYLGLSSALTAALVPRWVSVALAIPVTTLLGHPEMVSVTAAGVVLTGLIGSSLCISILNKVGAKDPITRGCLLYTSPSPRDRG